MRARFYQSLKSMNAWLFTGLAIILAVMLTTALNFFFAWVSREGLRPITQLFATIDAIVIPAILAPIFLHLFKRAANLEDMNRQSAARRTRTSAGRTGTRRTDSEVGSEERRIGTIHLYGLARSESAAHHHSRFSGLAGKGRAGGRSRSRCRWTCSASSTRPIRCSQLLDELLELSRIGRMMNPPRSGAVCG